MLGDAPADRLTMIRLPNCDDLQWETRLDQATVQKSEFAVEFLEALVERRDSR